MPVTEKGTGNESANLTGVTITAGATVVILSRERDGGGTLAGSDSVAGSYSNGFVPTETVAQVRGLFFQNHAGGTGITFTVTGGSQRDYVVLELTGVVTSGGPNQSATSNNASSTSIPHGSVTPSGSSILVGACGGNFGAAVTQPGGCTLVTPGPTGGGVDRQGYFYKINHTGTLNPASSVTPAAASDAGCMAFLEAASGVVGPLLSGHLVGGGILAGRLVH